MKKVLQLALCAGIFAPLVSSAALISVSDDFGSAFYDIVAGMNTDFADVEADFVAYQSLAYDVDNMNFVTDPDLVFDQPDPLSANTIYFKEISPNLDFFTINTWAKIGFVGNESIDQDQLYVTSYTDNTLATAVDTEMLFDYDLFGNPTPPPASRLISNISGDEEVAVQFIHNNPWKLLNSQDAEVRFKIYEAYSNPWNDGSKYYMIGIDDREDSLIDYDDGIFFLQIAPVPEPSQIAALAILGLGGVLLIRRRIKSRKA